MEKRRAIFVKKKSTIFVIIILIMGISVATGLFFMLSCVVRNCTLEAGDTLNVKELLRRESTRELCFEDGSEEFSTNIPGEYTLKVRLAPFIHTVKVTVVDTLPPTAVLKEQLIVPYQTTVEAAAFTESVSDVTAVTVEYVKTPDFNRFGLQNVQIALRDAGGNTLHQTAQMLIPKVKTEEPYEIEAGEPLPEADYFLIADGKASYKSLKSDIDVSKLGEYPAELQVDDYNCTITLRVVDTIAPSLQVAPLTWFLGAEPKADRFVTRCQDATAITYSFKEPYDNFVGGEQNVTVIATDEAGNTASADTKVTLIADTEAPVILGTGNLSTQVGGVISYRAGISAVDNCDESVEVKIDNSLVDLNTIGSYPVTYSARDHAGNETSIEVSVTVMPEQLMVYSMDEMYALADEVLAKIIKEDMTQYDKAQAIYIWTKGNISFIEDSEKEDWVESAYNGFTYHKGDCYTYACVAKALLTRAGIPNIDVKRKSVLSKHFWNLVDVGEGWYHFDATPRVDKTTVFMWSENQLLADPAVNRSHVYDRSLYPTVNAD